MTATDAARRSAEESTNNGVLTGLATGAVGLGQSGCVSKGPNGAAFATEPRCGRGDT